MMEGTKRICQNYRKGGTIDCFPFDSWFASKKTAEAAIYDGADLIGMVKINTKGFCKETIEKLTKDRIGDSYLMLRSKPIFSGVMSLISIDYKYNARKFLSFIVTDNAGITQLGIPYLSKYPKFFTNVAIHPVARTLVMSKFLLLLMRLTHTTNQDIMIWQWKSGGLLSVVGCGYVCQLLWE